MTYPVHVRKKILQDLETQSVREVATRHKISPTTIQNWKKQLEPKIGHNYPPRKISNDALRNDVERYPNASQAERAQRFNCSTSGIRDALKRLGIVNTHKKLK